MAKRRRKALKRDARGRFLKRNPRKSRRRRRRNPVSVNRRRSPKRRRRRNPVSVNRRRTKRRRRRNPGAVNMPKRRKARGRRRRGYRRNPPIIKTIQQGVMDAGAVVLGKALARTVPTLFKLPTAGTIGIAVQALSAVAAGIILRQLKLGGADFARFAVAGGLAAPIESFVKGAGIPFISDALGEYEYVGAYPQYPQLAAGEMTDVFGTDATQDAMGAYPQYGY